MQHMGHQGYHLLIPRVTDVHPEGLRGWSCITSDDVQGSDFRFVSKISF